MGSMSIMHWVLVGGVALILFGGRGKISDLMGDMAKGIKAFKKGLADEETPVASAAHPAEPVRSIEHRADPLVREPMTSSTLADRKLG